MRTRLFVDQNLGPGSELKLDSDAAQYLGRVLRLRVGDSLRVFNGAAGEFAAEVTAFSKQSVAVRIGERLLEAGASPPESPLRLHLVQGISRGDRMDFVVQKTTELGVKRITPVLTKHGAVRLDATRAAKRQAHWQRVAISAAEQCGRVQPPLIDAPLSLNDWLGQGQDRETTEIVLDPNSPEPMAAVAAPPTKLCLLVGPEGGLSDRELDDARIAGFQGVSLGPRILRTETAAVAAVTLAQSCFGDLGG